MGLPGVNHVCSVKRGPITDFGYAMTCVACGGAIRSAKSTSVAVKMIGPDASSRRIAPGQYPEIKLQKLQGVSSNGDSRILKVTKVGMCNEGRKAASNQHRRTLFPGCKVDCV